MLKVGNLLLGFYKTIPASMCHSERSEESHLSILDTSNPMEYSPYLELWRNVMSKAFESIAKGLTEAIEFAQGEPTEAVVHELTPLDIKTIRTKIGMTQTEFAAAFGISLGTLRHWERGDRTPHGPALVLLNVVAKEPEAVLRALNAA